MGLGRGQFGWASDLSTKTYGLHWFRLFQVFLSRALLRNVWYIASHWFYIYSTQFWTCPTETSIAPLGSHNDCRQLDTKKKIFVGPYAFGVGRFLNLPTRTQPPYGFGDGGPKAPEKILTIPDMRFSMQILHRGHPQGLRNGCNNASCARSNQIECSRGWVGHGYDVFWPSQPPYAPNPPTPPTSLRDLNLPTLLAIWENRPNLNLPTRSTSLRIFFF